MKCKCENIFIMEDFNCWLGQDAHVNHMNAVGRFTDAVQTTENEIHLLSFCKKIIFTLLFFPRNLIKNGTHGTKQE